MFKCVGGASDSWVQLSNMARSREIDKDTHARHFFLSSVGQSVNKAKSFQSLIREAKQRAGHIPIQWELLLLLALLLC